MKRFNIYFANGWIESTIQKSIKEAKIYAKKREKEIPMPVLQIYEDTSYQG